MIKLVLWGSVCWLPILMTYMLINETKFKKNLVLGVTFPQEAHEDPGILSVIRNFRRDTWIICGILIAMVPVFVLISGRNTEMTFWMFWLSAAIVLPYIPYVLSNRTLHQIKKEKGWKPERNTVMVDTSVITGAMKPSVPLFLLPALLCIVPVIWDRNMVWMYVMFSAICVLMMFGCMYLYRNKAEMVDENAELTKVLSQIRRRNWIRLWMLTSWVMAGFCLCSSLLVKYPFLMTAAMMVMTIVLVAYCFRLEMQTRRLQEKLTKESGTDWYVDDDDHWIGGLLYYNPDDSRLIMNNRVGLNSTVNTAHPAGMVLTVLLAAFLVLLPFSGIFLDRIGQQEIHLTDDGETVTAEAGITKYTIREEEIISAELLPELPGNLIRRNGTSMETLLKGNFTSPDTGDLKVIVDPENPPFILLRTENEAYLFGTRDASETERIYEVLK